MRVLFIIMISLSLFRCNKPAETKNTTNVPVAKNDTVVYSWEITDELAGRIYRKRAKGYALIMNGDTSAMKFSMLQSKRFGRVSMDITFQKSLSYREQYAQLKKLVPFAMKDFNVNPDSLQAAFIRRLISTGDLAIQVSKVYNERFEMNRVPDFKTVNQFLTESRLAHDWNALLQPYGIVTDTVFTEKVFFAEPATLPMFSKIESDSASFPPKILDCLVWLRFARKRTAQI